MGDIQELAKVAKESVELKERAGIWRPYLDLVNTFTYGKDASKIRKANGIDRTDDIIGYSLKNISSDITMSYINKVYKRDVNGKIVSSIEEFELKPGETVVFSKKFAAIFLVRPEFAMEIRNATMINTTKENLHIIENMVTKYMLKFKRNIDNRSVHDPRVKVNIAELVGYKSKGKGTSVEEYRVKEEYFQVFGWLDKDYEVEEKETVEDIDKVQVVGAVNETVKEEEHTDVEDIVEKNKVETVESSNNNNRKIPQEKVNKKPSTNTKVAKDKKSEAIEEKVSKGKRSKISLEDAAEQVRKMYEESRKNK